MFLISFIAPFIISIVYAVLGYIFWRKTPDIKSKKTGWRTSYSTKSEEAWQYANKVGGRYLFLMGIAELILAVGIYILCRNMNKEHFNFVAIIFGLLVLETGSFTYLNKYIEKQLKKL